MKTLLDVAPAFAVAILALVALVAVSGIRLEIAGLYKDCNHSIIKTIAILAAAVLTVAAFIAYFWIMYALGFY